MITPFTWNINNPTQLVKASGLSFALDTPEVFLGDSGQFSFAWVDDDKNPVNYQLDTVTFGFGEPALDILTGSDWEKDTANFAWRTNYSLDTAPLVSFLGTAGSKSVLIEARVTDGTNIQSYTGAVTLSNVVGPVTTDAPNLFSSSSSSSTRVSLSSSSSTGFKSSSSSTGISLSSSSSKSSSSSLSSQSNSSSSSTRVSLSSSSSSSSSTTRISVSSSSTAVSVSSSGSSLSSGSSASSGSSSTTTALSGVTSSSSSSFHIEQWIGSGFGNAAYNTTYNYAGSFNGRAYWTDGSGHYLFYNGTVTLGFTIGYALATAPTTGSALDYFRPGPLEGVGGDYYLDDGITAAGVIRKLQQSTSSSSSSTGVSVSSSTRISLSSASSASSSSSSTRVSLSSSSSTRASLSSSSSSTAVSFSTSSTSEPLVGFALNLFNGGGNWVEAPAAAYAAAPMTAEFWLKLPSGAVDQNQLYLANIADDETSYNWVLQNSNGGVGVIIVDIGADQNNITTGTGALVGNTWTHIALTIDGSNNCKLWVGGNLAGSGTCTVTTASLPLWFGDGDLGKQSTVDEIRISSVVRYNAPFNPLTAGRCFTVDAQTIAYWKCDEGSGSAVSDQTGNHNATWTGTPNWVADIGCAPDNSSSSSTSSSTRVSVSSSSSSKSSFSSSSSSKSTSSSTAVSLSSSSTSTSSTGRDFLISKNANLFHYYSLDESAAPWVDAISANNLTIALAPGEISSTGGKHNSALLMDMDISGITVAVHNTFCTNTPTSGGCAISFWAGGGSATGIVLFGGNMNIVYTGGSSFNGGVASAYFRCAQSNGTAITATGTLTGLTHIVGIAADGVVEIYGNGVLIGSQTFDNTFQSASNVLVENNGGSQFLVDELAYWKNITFGSSALRAEFVAALWNNGNGRFWNGTTFV